MHWLDVGDKNNKYFHRGETAREVVNSIREIECADGEIVRSPEQIKSEAERYFREFLQHKPPNFVGMDVTELQSLLSYRCSTSDREGLEKEVG